jgi:hypothetical protein
VFVIIIAAVPLMAIVKMICSCPCLRIPCEEPLLIIVIFLWVVDLLVAGYSEAQVRNRPALWSSFVAKWQNQRDGAPGSMHYLGQLNFEKIEVMWRELLIILDGILAQKMLIYIAANTLYCRMVSLLRGPKC